MAFFGNKKAEKKKNPATPRLRRACAAWLPAARAHEIIRAPWFSEKALLGTNKGVYVFAVPASATKPMIAAAIQIYNVSPKSIRTVNLRV